MSRLQPCLWFDNQAEEAAKFYASAFSSFRSGQVAKYGESGSEASGQKKGSTMTVEFEIDGLKILGLNGGPMFKFTAAMSFFVWRKSEAEVTELFQKLNAGGQTRMALDTYPWSKKYGWTTDRFGVEWQVMQSDERSGIAPAMLFTNRNFGRGEAALELYRSAFKNFEIEAIHRDPQNQTIQHCVFNIEGQPVCLMEGPGDHPFTFNEAFSLMISVRDQAEVDHFWNTLTADGGQESQCGWLKDKFGVSWQVVAFDWLKYTSDPAKSEKAFQALMKMKKPDLAKLKQAAES